MSLVINRLHSHFHSRRALDAGQCAQWLTALADADGDALDAELTGADEWLLIGKLPLALRWHERASAADITARWGVTLRQALQQALADPTGSNVVRYASRREAIADLLYRSALGERARQWAWVQMGLIARSGLGTDEALQHGVAVLLAEPALVWPVLHRLIAAEPATAALTALLRRLPAPHWQALLQASAPTAPYLRAQAESAPDARAQSAAAAPPIAAAEAIRLLAWAQARPHFAARHRDLLAVLIAALAWPGLASPALIRARLHAVDARLATVPGLAPGAARTPDVRPQPGAPSAAPDAAPGASTSAARIAAAPAAVGAQTAASVLPAARPADLPAPPALPAAIEWLPTRWAGALFWLGRIPASGLIDEFAADSSVMDPGVRDPDVADPGVPDPDVSMAQMLGAIARALGVPADDAAMRVFCGGEPGADALPPVVCARAADIVAGWAAWLDRAAPELPAPRLDAVCRRSGRLRFEPGWVELHLPLDGVHTAIRRLGLDLDPGWLPWLGCVLRIFYDE